jgi:hypothetical protein
MIDLYRGLLARFLGTGGHSHCSEAKPFMQNQGSGIRQTSVFLRRELRHQADWGPNRSFNRTCNGVPAQAVISFSACFVSLSQAG